MTSPILLDQSSTAPNPPPLLVRDGARRYKVNRYGKVVERDPRSIDTICLHQTATMYGPSNDKAKRNARAFGIPIHGVAFQDGIVVLPYPILWYLYHGNGWNDRALGLECEGLFPGLMKAPLLDETAVASFRLGVTALYERGLAMGCPIKYVVAHRQSSSTRRSDPGQEIWQRVALEHAIAVLKLKPMNDKVLAGNNGSGYPIPKQWDPRNGVGLY